jgi:hypothetical protein
MKKIVIIFLFILEASHVLSQENKSIPLYKGKYPVINKMFDKQVWSLFDSTHANGFVMVSFEISDKGNIENIGFSAGFPDTIKALISASLISTKNDWKPAYQNQIPVRKRLIQPIVYQYGGYQNFNFNIKKIIDAFDVISNNKFIDAIILPICLTGFAIR